MSAAHSPGIFAVFARGTLAVVRPRRFEPLSIREGFAVCEADRGEEERRTRKSSELVVVTTISPMQPPIRCERCGRDAAVEVWA